MHYVGDITVKRQTWPRDEEGKVMVQMFFKVERAMDTNFPHHKTTAVRYRELECL